jgi:hypothetical protein
MNERIRELAEQAGFSFKYKTAPDELNPGHTRQDLEKFAELIVKDCLNELCNQMDHFNIDLSNLPAWYKALEQTEKSFGIKQ